MAAMATPVRSLAFPARVSTRLRARVSAPRFAPADWTTGRTIVALPRRVGAVVVARATSTASDLRPPARAFELAAAVSASDKSTPAGSSFSWFTHVLVPAFAASALAVLTACVAGFLVAVREMVRACREATIASRAVSQCAESINSACAALEATLVKADKVLDDVDNIGSTTASVLETASREAGVLQRRLSDLPNTASRTLMEAITQQYSSPLPGATTDEPTGAWAGDVRIEIGSVIEGERTGARWLGGAPGCNFTFNRGNRFRVGEYCAVPRTNNTYTWGVIELNDLDYSVDESGDEEGEEALSCVWPPRDPDDIPDTCVDGSRDIDAPNVSASGGNRGWFERGLVALVGSERSDRVEGFVRQITGLTPVEEGEYKVVVELDTSVYSFKIMNAGDLGKRVK